MAITVAAVIVFGTLTVGAAAYYNWSNGLSEELRIDEEKQKMLEDTGMAAFSEVSCTDAGVTVTAQQSITDNYYTYLSFKFEGYELEEGKEPSIENVSVTVDGSNEFSWGGSFYGGLICGQMDELFMQMVLLLIMTSRYLGIMKEMMEVWNITWY